MAASADGVPGIDRMLTPPPTQQQQHTAYWSSSPRQDGKKGLFAITDCLREEQGNFVTLELPQYLNHGRFRHAILNSYGAPYQERALKGSQEID